MWVRFGLRKHDDEISFKWYIYDLIVKNLFKIIYYVEKQKTQY